MEKTKNNKNEYEYKIFRDIELTGDEIVTQSDSLINSIKQMNLRELKLFSFLISKVNSSQSNDLRFRVRANVIAKVFGVRSTESIYRDIPSIIKNLTKKVITIHPEEKDKQILIAPLSYAKYHKGKGFADVEISPDLVPYILDPYKDDPFLLIIR